MYNVFACGYSSPGQEMDKCVSPPPPPQCDLDPLRAAMAAGGTTVSMADLYNQGGWYRALCACVSQVLQAHSHLAAAYGGINTFWET